MSRSGEAWGAGAGAGARGVRSGLVRVDAAHIACPVCGRRKFCSVTRDGGMAWCTVVENDIAREYSFGTAWVHVLDPSQRLSSAALAALPQSTIAGPVEVRDRVYRALLEALPLDSTHRANLLARGLDAQRIFAGGYASLPLEGRGYVARSLAARFTERELDGVPGFYRWANGAWAIAGSPGLLVPVRDITGAIVALKIRLDDATEGRGRYRFLTSGHKGGAKAAVELHVPVGVTLAEGGEFRITEGELKADVTTVLSGLATLSVPGADGWRWALRVAEALRPSRVRVAFDMDRETNPAVARAQRELVTALRAQGIRVGVESWDPAHKGIDDFLNARRATRDHE